MSTERRRPATDAKSGGVGLCHFGAGLLQLGHERAQVLGVAIGDGEVAAGDGAGHQEGPRFDAVGNDAVLGAVQLRHALNANDGCAGAVDLGAHCGEQVGQVDHFGLAGGIAQHGFALGQDRGHHQVFGAGDGDAVEVDGGAAQAIGRFGFDVAVRLVDARAQLFQAEDVQVDGAGADGASAGKRNARAAARGPPAGPAPGWRRAWS